MTNILNKAAPEFSSRASGSLWYSSRSTCLNCQSPRTAMVNRATDQEQSVLEVQSYIHLIQNLSGIIAPSGD